MAIKRLTGNKGIVATCETDQEATDNIPHMEVGEQILVDNGNVWILKATGSLSKLYEVGAEVNP